MDTARTKRTRSRWMLAVALAYALPALGATVYKTVDADGKVSYSDTPPPQGVAAEVIETRDTYPGPDPDATERLQQMRETTDRLRADRLEREQARALPPAPAYPDYPEEDDSAQHDDDEDRWLLPYYPPYRRWRDGDNRPRPPRPPRPPYAEPEPLPSGSSSLSPRGLQERLRKAR